ncbi:MAG: retropepsin-like domain-containing protein [Bacteroides sp.]|nr:retropepsin-like domain-containing protein [Bacteroides sp.]
MRYDPFFSVCFFVFCLVTMQACRTHVSDPVVDNQLSQWLEKKDFFRLREELVPAKNKLSPDRWLFYQAHCNHAFGREEESNGQIRTLFDTYGHVLSDTLKKDLLEIQAQNYSRLFRYAEAADTYLQLIREYAAVADSAEVESYRNMYALWQPVRDVLPQRITKTKDVKIPLIREGNHYRIAVTCGGVTENLFFDTGANLSSVSESIAAEMGLTLYDTDIEVATSTPVRIQSRLGVADSLWLGDLLVENVVFLVMPDEVFYIAPIDFHIKGTIGFPVMYQMEEVHMYRHGELEIPARREDRELNNLFLDHLHPVVRIYSGSESLLFTLDTGAADSELYRTYYRKHEAYIQENVELTEGKRGGAGGIEEVRKYVWKDFPYRLGGGSGTLPEISIIDGEYVFADRYDGNLGQDVFGQYHKLILNFREMYVDVE